MLNNKQIMKNTYKQPVNRIIQQDIPKPVNKFIQEKKADNRIIQQEQNCVNRFIQQDSRVIQQDSRVIQQDSRVIQPVSKILQQDIVQKQIHNPNANAKPVYSLQPQQVEMLHQLKAQQGNPLQYIHESMWCLVVKKRNIALEKQNYENLEKNDIYEIVSFNTTNKGASIAFVNYKPVNTPEWRVIAKYVKKIAYNNVNFDIDTSPTFNETKY
jgi:hypothetical protein